MESKIIWPEIKNPEPLFPKICMSSTGNVVLFRSLTSGTVLAHTEASTFKIGMTDDEFIPCTDPYWEELPNGTIVQITI